MLEPREPAVGDKVQEKVALASWSAAALVAQLAAHLVEAVPPWADASGVVAELVAAFQAASSAVGVEVAHLPVALVAAS